MTINREDLLAVFPHLNWVIHEATHCADGTFYESADAEVLAGEEHERGYITLIVYSSGVMQADLQATYSDNVGCSSFPPRSEPYTVVQTLQSLRQQIEWRHRLFGSAIRIATPSSSG
jgi:hypothetical protein